MLSESERTCLLQVARHSIESVVSGRPGSEVSIDASILGKTSGAFVTLRIDHELRGCIGYVDPKKPLVDTVHDAAEKAAMEDLRFPAVTADELAIIAIEISVLSPMKSISSIVEIEVGSHGLVVELGTHRGLLLPQVAVEYGWDAAELLKQTIRKAGLEPGIIKHRDLRLFIFTAEIFSESRDTTS